MTSASFASFLKIATPSGSRRLRVRLPLLRCRFWKSKPWRLPPMPSPVRPPGISILIAWAPQSTSCRTHVGPARARVRSSTVKRASGNTPLCAMVLILRCASVSADPPGTCAGSAPDHVADRLEVPGGGGDACLPQRHLLQLAGGDRGGRGGDQGE